MRINHQPERQMCPSCGDCPLPPGADECMHCDIERADVAEAMEEHLAELIQQHPIRGRIARARRNRAMRRYP